MTHLDCHFTTPKRARTGFTLLALVQASLIFTITLIAVPLPLIGQEFSLSSADLVVLQVSYGLPYSGLLLLGGRLTDRFGGTGLMRIGLWMFGLASVGAALALDFHVLLAMRALQGAAAALVAPAALSVVRALFPDPAAFDRAMARWGGVSVLGAAAGAVLSGVVTTWLSWRWMFFAPIAVTALALLLMNRLLPIVSRGERRPALDLVGAGFALLGLSFGGYGLALGSEGGWSTPIVWGTLLVGGLLLLGFARTQRRVADPLLPPAFLRGKDRLSGVFGIFLAAASMALVTFILALFLQGAPGWSPLATAGAMAPYLAVLILGGKPAMRLTEGLGATATMLLGFILSAIGLWLLSGFGADYVKQILPGLVLLPAGTSLIFAASAVLITRNTPSEQMGLAGGVLNTAMELGPTAGLAGFMAFASLGTLPEAGWALAFQAAAGVAITAAIITAIQIREK